MEAVVRIAVVPEQALWLTEEEAFTLLMGLVRGAAAGSRAEDALLTKVGEVCRSFLKGGRPIPIEELPQEHWTFDPCELDACSQAA